MSAIKNICRLAVLISALVAREAKATTMDTINEDNLNATGASIMIDPFRTPTGPFADGSGNWTWNIATESSAGTTLNTTSIRQILWLYTDPDHSLRDPDLGYLGCGLLIHGLKQSVEVKGQNDPSGTCGSVLSKECSAQLQAVTAGVGTNASTTQGQPIDHICSLWQQKIDLQQPGASTDCVDTFEEWAWIETFPFASPQLPPPSNNNTPTVSEGPFTGFNLSGSTEPLASWGEGTYTTTNLTTYNNLTTSITPLLSVMFANHTTDRNLSSAFSSCQLVCLRPSNIDQGSVKPTALASAGARERTLRVEGFWVASLSFVLVWQLVL